MSRRLGLPPAEMREAAGRDLLAEHHNRRLWEVIREIQLRLASIGVGAAVAKGVVAENRWYDRPGERPCVDIDLVLEPTARTRFDDVIGALHPTHPLRPGLPILVRQGILQSVDVTVLATPVDIHADILKFEIPTRSLDTIWSRTVEVAGPDDLRVRALDAETSLVHFLLHLNKDRFARLIGFADVARLLSREALDWGFVDAFLAREGLRVPVYNSLYVVTDTLGLDPPPVQRPEGWRSRVWQRLWGEETRLWGHAGLVNRTHRQFLIPLLAEGRTTEGIRWLARRRLFPPRAMLPLYYPDTKGPYLVRVATGRLLRARDRRRAAQRFRQVQ